MTLVFVYGTLKRGYWNNQLLKDQKFLGEAKTAARYRLYDASRQFPFLVERPKGVACEGEVWEVNDETLAGMDKLEGVPHSQYKRVPIALQDPFAAQVVLAYIWQGSVEGCKHCSPRWENKNQLEIALSLAQSAVTIKG